MTHLRSIHRLRHFAISIILSFIEFRFDDVLNCIMFKTAIFIGQLFYKHLKAINRYIPLTICSLQFKWKRNKLFGLLFFFIRRYFSFYSIQKLYKYGNVLLFLLLFSSCLKNMQLFAFYMLSLQLSLSNCFGLFAFLRCRELRLTNTSKHTQTIMGKCFIKQNTLSQNPNKHYNTVQFKKKTYGRPFYILDFWFVFCCWSTFLFIYIKCRL